MIGALVKGAVSRRVTVLMATLGVIAFGLVAMSRLPLNLLPDVSFPSITIQTPFPSAAPEEVESLVTKPIEETVGVLKGLKEIRSVSRSGLSEVVLTFGWGTDMAEPAVDIREKIDRLELPEDTERPVVLRYDPSLDPIMRLAVSGPQSLTALRWSAEKEIKEAIEKIEGIAAARVRGGEEEEVAVDLDQGRLAAMGIAFAEVAELLARSNINRPGGAIKGKESTYLVRTLNEYDELAEIADLIITPRDRPPVRLGEVARVRRAVKDRVEITRVNGQEAVLVEVFKEGDANTVRVAADVRLALDELGKELPKEMKVALVADQSRFITTALAEVRDALLLGGMLAIAVLLIFLRDVWATVIIATAIPLSVVASFVLMYRLDVSLNIMSLGGLTLGIGMLVDAAIVVLEAIHRRRAAGATRRAAAIQGTVEVGAAVTASVLTTVAVFLPIAFVAGVAGQLFRDQALTVTFSQLASLLVALTVVPAMAAGRAAPRSTTASTDSGPADNLREGKWMAATTRAFEMTLRWVLRHRSATLGVAAILFAAAVGGVVTIDRELVPRLMEGEFFFEVGLPEGSSLAATSEAVGRMEKMVAEVPDIALSYSTVGSRNVAGGMALKTQDESLAQVFVELRDRSDERQEDAIAGGLRERFARLPGVSTRLGRQSFFTLKTPVEILFFGDDLAALRSYTTALVPRLGEITGLREVRASLESGNPELAVTFDPRRLARHGLTIGDVADTLAGRIQGRVVSQLRTAEKQIDVRLRNRAEDRESLGDVNNLVVAQQGTAPITLKAVAAVTPAQGPAEIHRIQQSRAAIITADVVNRGLAATTADVMAVLKAWPPPAGVSAELAGQDKEMQESFASLRFAIALAIFMVYLVMAATFENLVHPLIIVFSVPLALVGVVAGLLAAGYAISVIALIGAVLLVGVVVNNAIVLIDAINRFRRQGMDKVEAIVAAGRVRLRPILMTALTTVLGLLPMAFGFGEGAELRAPLAVVVSSGLVASTLLTLLVIPVLYDLVPSAVSAGAERELAEALQLAERWREEAEGISGATPEASA
ncbi:MAG: efflux RND transporter permease subunit [Candidatus Schekmanbacteria bacterium]|nr:efflux RND transporter permease subunit [Candidatus Schekmanbacteria bacterium]